MDLIIMLVSLENLESALRIEDVESLIAGGAPQDEYDSEAKEIFSALASLSADKQTEANIVVILSLVWAKTFNLSAQDTEKRIPAFQRIAHRLL